MANVKVSAQQQCVHEGLIAKLSTANERKEHYIEKYIQSQYTEHCDSVAYNVVAA